LFEVSGSDGAGQTEAEFVTSRLVGVTVIVMPLLGSDAGDGAEDAR
jgi:hypothetical protein